MLTVLNIWNHDVRTEASANPYLMKEILNDLPTTHFTSQTVLIIYLAVIRIQIPKKHDYKSFSPQTSLKCKIETLKVKKEEVK